ncbi:MAG TPA: ATP-binding protein [Acidobacteriota bacterium]|nr:ATP-binding protein [Acidobacteriota bacterium]
METSFAIAILAVIHGMIFLTLIIILLSDRWRRSHFRFRRQSKRESRIEQKMVGEAIAACVLERDLLSLLRSIGRRAAELNGFEDWIAWLRDEQGEFYPASFEGRIVAGLADSLRGVEEASFFKWVRVNHTPFVLDKKSARMAESTEMQKLLQEITPGLLIPFLDGQTLFGLLVLGGQRRVREQRSEQFLALFGAFAAILIRKVLLDEEERRLQERQQRAESLASMGKVAAGIAHEIRNPLTFIRSAAEQLAEESAGIEDAAELLGGIVEEIVRVNERIEELLSLGRMDRGIFEPVALDEVVRSSARLVEARARERDIAVVIKTRLDDARVLGSSDRLRQLFLNLMLNGIEAMQSETGGELTVRAHADAGTAVIEIEDDGPGIPPEARERVFEPFFTTKDKGTGLGLALCFSIANAHGGSVELRSTGEEGTCFAVELPLHKE